MSRLSFSGARTGQRMRTGSGGLINQFEWEMGDRKRLIFPIVNDSLVLLGKPYHPVVNRGAVVFPKTNGQGTYAVDKVRCTHVNSQTTFEEGYEIAKKGEPCVFCQVALYEERRKWATIRERFPNDAFASLTKEEKKAVFNEIDENGTVDASYYSEQKADGATVYSTHFDIYILALELSLDAQGQVIRENGLPKYQAVLMPASKARLDKFKVAVENALMSGMLSREMLSPFTENQGTAAEEEVLIGWVDFLVTFPQKSHKMESGKDMGVMPMAQGATAVTPEFKNAFAEKATIYDAEAVKTFDRLFVNLQARSAEDAKSLFAAGAGYVDELASLYRITTPITDENGNVKPTDDEREASIFQKAIENYEKYNQSTETEGAENVGTSGATQGTTTPPTNTEVGTQVPVAETTQAVVAETQTAPMVETVPPTPTPNATVPTLDDSVFDI